MQVDNVSIHLSKGECSVRTGRFAEHVKKHHTDRETFTCSSMCDCAVPCCSVEELLKKKKRIFLQKSEQNVESARSTGQPAKSEALVHATGHGKSWMSCLEKLSSQSSGAVTRWHLEHRMMDRQYHLGSVLTPTRIRALMIMMCHQESLHVFLCMCVYPMIPCLARKTCTPSDSMMLSSFS